MLYSYLTVYGSMYETRHQLNEQRKEHKERQSTQASETD